MKIYKIIRFCIISFVLLIAVVISYISIQKIAFKKSFPNCLGFGWAQIASGSMLPEYEVGSIVIIHEQNNYDIGNVITFLDNDNRLVTHRIVSVTDDGYVTKGDNNNSNDNEIKQNEVCGKIIFKSKALGSFIDYLRTPIGIISVFLIIVILYFLERFINKKFSTKE